MDNQPNNQSAEPRRRAASWRVEAACVAAVVGVLGCLTWATGETRQQQVCQSRLKQVGLGIMQYLRDYDEMAPPKANWPELVNPYVKSMALFDCPGSSTSYALHEKLSAISISRVTEPALMPLAYDSTLNQLGAWDLGQSWPVQGVHRQALTGPLGANTLFFDGHVKWAQQKPSFAARLER